MSNNAYDPYAGQYPPPPPLPAEDIAVHEQLYRRQSNPEPFYLIDQSYPSDDHPSGSHTITSMSEIRGHYYEDAMDLRDYLYAERQEKLQTAVYSDNQTISPAIISPPVLFEPSFVFHPPRMMVNSPRHHCCGVSCFACIWTLLFIVIFLAGIALIVLSIVMGNQCNSEFAAHHVILCRQEFHDGTLYGGIVIAGLAAFIIVWQLLKWLCRNPL